MDFAKAVLVEGGVSVRLGGFCLSYIGGRWTECIFFGGRLSGRLCLNFIGGRLSECVLEADFVEAALVEDGVSVRFGQTLLKLHWGRWGKCSFVTDFVEMYW